VKLGAKIVETNRGFITKLWNAARFCEMNGCKPNPGFKPEEARLPLSRWILAAANTAIADATAALEALRPNDYASACYRFAWGDFCDWFLEFAKPAFASEDAAETRDVAAHVLGILLRLMHPLTPFVTEELYDYFGYGDAGTLISAPWPEPVAVFEAPAAVKEVGWVVDLISTVRTVRSEMNVPPSLKSPLFLQDAAPETLARAAAWFEAISRMARASEAGPLPGPVPAGAAQAVLHEATIILPLAGIIDLDAERKRLGTARAKAAAELAKVEGKLANPDFVSRARQEVLDEHYERREAFTLEVQRLDAALGRIA
jgi:valyl-tRNA synthetase